MRAANIDYITTRSSKGDCGEDNPKYTLSENVIMISVLMFMYINSLFSRTLYANV